MKVVVVVLVVVLAVGSAQRRYDGHQLFSLLATNNQQAAILERLREADGMDFWTHVRLNSPIHVHVTPHAESTFRQLMTLHGIQTNQIVSNLQILIDNESANHKRHLAEISKHSSLTNVDYTPNYADLQKWMSNIADTYEFASLITFGNTTEGREMQLIKLSTGRSGKKQIVFLDGGMHAREWLTTASLIWIINQMASNYDKDTAITQMMDDFDFYLMPVINPDGYEYSHTHERFWRKNRSANKGYPNCPGTDLNRNFDYPQFGGPGASVNPCSSTYRGVSGISEVENIALRDFLLENGDNVAMYNNIHAYSQLWFTPWGFSTDRPDDAQAVDDVAKAGAKALFAVHQKYFEVGPPSLILYAASGSAMDWAKGTAGIKYSFSMELRPDGDSGGFRGFLVDQEEVPESGEELLAGIQAALLEIQTQQKSVSK